MSHGHSHSHAPDPGAPGDHRRVLWIAFGLTATIVVAQLVGSVLTGSLALLTDTAHAAADAAGLLVAVIAATLSLRPPTPERTWGFRRIEILAALGQATLLLAVAIYAAFEGISRLYTPPDVPGPELIVFGVIGLAANVAAILLLTRSRKVNLNLRAAFLEVVGDALGSLGVIVAGVVIWTTGFERADAIAGLAIAALIAPRAWVLMRDATSILMEFTPRGLDIEAVRRHIEGVEHVLAVHDLHASTVATGLPTLSAHVVVDDECFRDGHAAEVLANVRACVAGHFDVSILHSTFQIEPRHLSAAEPEGVRHP